MNINIDLDLYPKLKNIENIENIENTINYLIQIGYNNVFIDNQNDIVNKIVYNLKNEITLSNDKVEIINDQINKLFGVSSSSAKKGEISENIIAELICNNFPDYSYEVKRHIAHNGDGMIISPTDLKCLVEVKNYSKTVPLDEINKFKYDLKFNNINYGLFISFKTNIIGQKNFDIETYVDNDIEYTIVYIAKLFNNELLINNGIYLLEKVFEYSNNNNTKTLLFNNLEHHFNELNEIINKTNNLQNEFINMESNIKKSFNDFYLLFRNYEIDLKNQIKLIWNNINEDINNIYLQDTDDKNTILNKYKNDNLFLVLDKLFNEMLDFSFVINNTLIEIVKERKIIGKIKKMKDKLCIELDDSIKINLTKNNYEKNINILKNFL